MRVTKSIWQMLLCVCILALTVGLVIPAVAAQEPDTVLHEWVRYANPLYPQLQTPSCRKVTATRDSDAPVCRETLQEAAKDLRQGMQDREETVVVSFMSDVFHSELANALFDLAIAHTGEPTGGDYILWHHSGWGAQLKGWHADERYRIQITYTVYYLSTQEQEEEMDTAVQKLLDQLDVYNASDHQKVTAIYDYLCENIEYDYSGALSGDPRAHTAYAALIDGKAVCQGYASLFYRLALALGVDNRVISGVGNGGAHGWNIVKLGGKYYDLDATWDATRKQNGQAYKYFLRCDANFEDHLRDEQYLTKEFYQVYPMARVDYGQPETQLPGDLDGASGVTEDDAIYLLQYVLMPDLFEVTQAVDFDTNGEVNEDDAIYLLQHVLMPDFFPIG